MARCYELRLPVYKQGSDLSAQIEEAKGNISKGLQAQAALYNEAARLCVRMSEVTTKNPDIKIVADTHTISVEGSEKKLRSLEVEGLLSSFVTEDVMYDEGTN